MKKIYLLLVFISTALNSFSQIDTSWGAEQISWCPSLRNCNQIITDTTGLWQIGSTTKPFFDTIVYPNAAIMTDTVYNYGPNKLSYFQLSFVTPNDANFMLTFDHKYQTDSLKDGGYIEASYDTGKTWINVVYGGSVEFLSQNLYSQNNLINDSTPAFTGTQSEWITTDLEWIYLFGLRMETGDRISGNGNVFPDSLLLRFYFKSDTANANKAGWIIKDFTTYAIGIGGYISTVNNNSFFVHYNNPVENSLNITTNEAIHVEIIDLTGREIVSYNPQYENTIELDVSFVPSGLYFLRVRNSSGATIVNKFIKQ